MHRLQFCVLDNVADVTVPISPTPMMENYLKDNDGCEKTMLGSNGPLAIKILKLISHKEIMGILNITQDQCTTISIYTKSWYSWMMIYRRTSDLVDATLLFAIGGRIIRFWGCLGVEYVINAKTFAKDHYSWIKKTKKLSIQELMDN